METQKAIRPYFQPVVGNLIIIAAIAAEFLYVLYDKNWGLGALFYSFSFVGIGFIWNAMRLFKSVNSKSKWAHASALLLLAAIGAFFLAGIIHVAEFYAN